MSDVPPFLPGFDNNGGSRKRNYVNRIKKLFTTRRVLFFSVIEVYTEDDGTPDERYLHFYKNGDNSGEPEGDCPFLQRIFDEHNGGSFHENFYKVRRMILDFHQCGLAEHLKFEFDRPK